MTVTFDVASAFRIVIAIIFLAVAFGIVMMLIGRVTSFFASRKFRSDDLDAMRKRWEEIEAMIGSSGEMNRKMAVLEADKLLDQALKSLTMPGETLGERLKFAAYKYPDLKEVWWAHKIRNQLAHETSYHLDPGLAKKAIKAFKKALTRLGAI
jgi:hypothetical protein